LELLDPVAYKPGSLTRLEIGELVGLVIVPVLALAGDVDAALR
jgi:hypothetical protein